MTDIYEETAIVKSQIFDNTMKDLSVISDSVKNYRGVDKIVPQRIWGIEKKDATVDAVNNVVAQVDEQLINLKDFNLKVFDLINILYKLLSALDKKHLEDILETAKTAEKASSQAMHNCNNISDIITFLKQLNYQQLNHLKNIDQIWIDLETQKEQVKCLEDFRNEIFQIKHIKDVDKLWENSSLQSKALDGIAKRLGEISNVLQVHEKSIANITGIVNGISDEQRALDSSVNKQISEHQHAIDLRLDGHKKDLQERLNALKETFRVYQEDLTRKIDAFSEEQTNKLFFIEQSQGDKLSDIERIHTDRLSQIEIAQAEQLNAIHKDQAEALAQIDREQAEKFEIINKSLEEEKIVLNEAIANLTQKIKIAYIVAGGATAITVIHLFLSILGVI